VSLLSKTFNFVACAIYNSVAPTLGTGGQASYLQCDQNGRLLVTIAGITGGVAPLFLPVTTTSRGITTPGLANGFAVSAPFNTSAAVAIAQTMPTAPVRGMRVLVIDSGGFAAVTPCGLVDNTNLIQSPMNLASLLSPLPFKWSGFAAMWEFVAGDPTNGNFWANIRSLE